MCRNSMIFACAALTVLLVQGAVHATTIQNASFESPDVSASPYYQENSAADWTVNGYWNAVIYNCDSSPHGYTYSGVNGSQYLGISSWSTAVSQVLDDTFESGKSYKLTASLAVSHGDHGEASRAIAVRLFWGDTSEPTTMAANTLGSIDKTCSDLSITAFTDYSVTISSDMIAAANAAGEKIGIEIAITNQGAGANFGVDNVRLDVIPEPSTLMLGVTAMLGLLAYAWRKRR